MLILETYFNITKLYYPESERMKRRKNVCHVKKVTKNSQYNNKTFNYEVTRHINDKGITFAGRNATTIFKI